MKSKKSKQLICYSCMQDINGAYQQIGGELTYHIQCIPEPQTTTLPDGASAAFGESVTLGPDEVWTPGARKNDGQKPDMSLMPLVAMEETAKAFMVGADKYGRYNYTAGMEVSRLVAAIMRHTMAYMDGENNCPTDGQHHLGSVIACAAMILEQAKLGTLIDNRRKTEVR